MISKLNIFCSTFGNICKTVGKFHFNIWELLGFSFVLSPRTRCFLRSVSIFILNLSFAHLIFKQTLYSLLQRNIYFSMHIVPNLECLFYFRTMFIKSFPESKMSFPENKKSILVSKRSFLVNRKSFTWNRKKKSIQRSETTSFRRISKITRDGKTKGLVKSDV